MTFVYGQARSHGGYTWYCQKPGSVWKTDPSIGYEMEWRRRSCVEGGDTGWHLYGGGHFGTYLDRRFADAALYAAELLKGAAE